VDVGVPEMALFLHAYFKLTDSSMFEDFIEQLLHYCGRWAESKSVVIMDNVPFHRTKRIK
jgi:hypothetical protein